MVPNKKSSPTRSARPTRPSNPTIPLSHVLMQRPSRQRNTKLSRLLSTFPSITQTDVKTDKLPMAHFRPAAPIPEHIREHCTIYLDEQLYPSAITLLSDLVSNGQASSDRETCAIYAPPPFHIELVACLLVHPRYTSQAPPDERTQLTSQAVTFLRNTLSILGPLNGNLQEALSLTYEETRSARRRAYNNVQYEYSDSDSDERPEHIKGVIANGGRLRRCAKDFWHIVGWAFNCSIRYPKRWIYWKVWLAFMIDVLDADWNERERLDNEVLENPDLQLKREINPNAVQRSRLQDCLLLQFLVEAQGRSSPLTRIVRSVFADASTKSLLDFPEVFTGETRDIRHTGQKRKRGNRFGDYNDEDDEIDDAADTTDQTSDAFDIKDEMDATEIDPYLGGSEAMALRQKLVKLLSRAAHFRQDDFVDTADLYEAIYLGMKELPVSAFSLFITPPFRSEIPSEAYISISMLYLKRSLPNSAPDPRNVQSNAADELSDVVLVKCYLPFAAGTSSVTDNARVSIQIENLLRLFLKACTWKYSPGFVAVIEKGIVARENKVKSRRGKDAGRKDRIEQEDLVWLKASGERLRTLAKFMETKQRSDE